MVPKTYYNYSLPDNRHDKDWFNYFSANMLKISKKLKLAPYVRYKTAASLGSESVSGEFKAFLKQNKKKNSHNARVISECPFVLYHLRFLRILSVVRLLGFLLVY